MVIRGVLREELENSLRLKKTYERELSKIPKGSLIKKERKGHFYYYLQFREGNKVKQIYKGKLSKEELNEYKERKEYYKRLKKMMCEVNKQIKYIKAALGGKRRNRTKKAI